MDDGSELRAVEDLDVPKTGAVMRGETISLPWRLVDGSGGGIEHVNLWLAELYACDSSAATLRAYSYDLLAWTRFLEAIQIHWARAARWEVRDWVRWYRSCENPQRRRGSSSGNHRPAAGSVNELTGKTYLEESYSRSTINRRLSSLSSFYEFAVESDLGPLVNPVPKSRGELTRVDAHRQHFDTARHAKRAPYRQKRVDRNPRALSDALYEEVFAALTTNRDRAIVATAVSAGLRASELLSMRRGMLHAADQTADIIPKGGRGNRVLVRISPAAYLWIARYLAERPIEPPEEPVWMTLRGKPRPLTYWAMRQVLERTNAVLGSNITMHDFRHTFCMRLAEDENLTIAEMQELMRHSSIASTTRYLRPTLDDLVEKLDSHWNRPPTPAPKPANGYAAEDLRILFGRAF
ncbi:site-specific recombinase XerD (plasmid) [Mycobacterium sp. JS623]|uniref:tyrosine-type recombinase/integrase n=1 Tax=Mycobacterium sp. JS623 TaxID=212767 RepID=UPI0002A58F00|nr:site-specific integrase [Mycobacterium sp. JS623]AGB26817.1 site-specific recombinase XerD [Mycobacterium sp. JS623]